MKLIEPSIEIVKQTLGKEGLFKHIEKCGRVSYKSENKITEDSANEFVGRRLMDGHTAILEHGTIYLEFPHLHSVEYSTSEFVIDPKILRYTDNPYSVVNTDSKASYVTTNYRVLYENGWLDDIYNMCAPKKQHELRITIHITTNRGVTHELVRHRVFSFTQESTRYCNYSQGKFGEELTFIKPAWYDSEKDTLLKQLYDETLYNCEQIYLTLIKGNFKPQEARGILVNDLKAEIYMTGTMSQWKEFLKLRNTPLAHPDMQIVAKQIAKELAMQYPETNLN